MQRSLVLLCTFRKYNWIYRIPMTDITLRCYHIAMILHKDDALSQILLQWAGLLLAHTELIAYSVYAWMYWYCICALPFTANVLITGYSLLCHALFLIYHPNEKEKEQYTSSYFIYIFFACENGIVRWH